MTRDRLFEQAIELLAIADFHSLTLKEERNQVVREAIELSRQPKQEPVIDQSAAIRIATALGWEPQRPWVGLTGDEVDALHTSIKVRLMGTFDTKDIYRAVEQALKEKNT